LEEILASELDPKFRAEVAKVIKNDNFYNCLNCGMCTGGCVYSDVHEGMNPRRFIRKVLLGMKEDALKDPFVWFCTMCERCTVECPMGVNMGAVVRTVRGNFGLEPPGFMQKVVDDTIRTGNQMEVSPEDYIETLEWLEEELQAELDDPDYKIPIDKENADFLFGFNAREVRYYPQDLQATLKIFYAAGANYTLSSKKWDATNLALFSGNDKDFWEITGPMLEEVVRLKAKELIVTECGHAFRSVKHGYRNFWKGPEFPVRHILQLLNQWIKEGRLKLDPDKIAEAVTYHDPCNTARKEGVFEDGRDVLKSFVKDYREMDPNRKYNYCCGAGGGALAMPEFKEQRIAKGRLKAEQVRKTGAKIVAVPCHNCMDQFNDITSHYELGTKNEHVCTIMEKALILPEKEEKE
jgi:Fe-S oxidoreductase